MKQKTNFVSTICAAALVMNLAVSTAAAQVFDERFDDWPLHTTQAGSLVVAGSLSDLSAVPRRILDSMGRKVDVIAGFDAEGLDAAGLELGEVASIDQEQSDPDRPLLLAAEELHSSSQHAAAVTKLAKARIVVGGVVMVIGASKLTDSAASGGHLLPDCRVVTSYDPQESEDAMVEQLRDMPRTVGVGLGEGAVLILSGRKAMCFGSNTHFVIASRRYEGVIKVVLRPRIGGQDIHSWLVDLTQLRRRAVDHELEPFPPAKPATPNVPNGTLMIVGGGGMPAGLMDDFVSLAGGSKAKLVFVPCLESNEAQASSGTVRQWKQMGVASAVVLHTKDRRLANEDEAFFAPLVEATGIWFGGGRQWNFADSYYGTTTHRLMKEVVRRGGVIGGSSAGASIQARYLARATPIQNYDIMAPGYERGGLGFISGVAIDQHFSQRNRHGDMKELVAKYPQLLGIGIDEATAITVRGSEAVVRGSGKVFFFDSGTITALPSGKSYDLAKRTFVRPSESQAVSPKD